MDLTYLWVMVILIGLLGVAFIGIGLYGLIRRKPFVISARYIMALLILAFVPSIINSGRMLLDPIFESSRLISAISLVGFGLVAVVFWFQMSGYTIFGVTDETFRKALHSALNQLNLPFSEELSRIRLTSLDADLQAAVAGWMGSAQLRVKQRQHSETLKKIASALGDYFTASSEPAKMTPMIIYTVLGVFVLAMSVALWAFIVSLGL